MSVNDWFEAEHRIERAHELAESHQWAAALVEIDAAIDINPHNGAWRAQRGYILDQLQRFEEAVAAYRSASDLEPGDLDVKLALGVDLARTGRCEDALTVLEEVARQEPDREPAYCFRILAYTDLGEHERAEEMFYLAQQIKEECPHCFFHVGGSLASRGQYEKAITCWVKTLDIDPAYPGVKQCIARAYREQGKLDRAREYYLAELREDPGDVDLLFEIAELEAEAGQPDKAAGKLQQIVELDPEYGQAHFALGEVLLEMGEAAEAVPVLRRATELDPAIPHLHLRLGQALLAVAKTAEARRCLLSAVAEDSEDKEALMSLGNCLLRMGDSDAAAARFRQVLALEEALPEAHHNLGVCFFMQGDYVSGLKHELRAVELNPCDQPAVHKAVLALVYLRRWSQARTMIQQSLELNPDDAVLREVRARLWRFRLTAIAHRVQSAGAAVYAVVRSAIRRRP